MEKNSQQPNKALYTIRPLSWNDGDYMSFSNRGRFSYMIENFEGQYYCSQGGNDFTTKPTREEAKQACEDHYNKELQQYLDVAITIEQAAN